MKKKIILISAVVFLMTAFFMGCDKSGGAESSPTLTQTQNETAEDTAQSQKPAATPEPSDEASVGLLWSGADYETGLVKQQVESLMAVSSIKITVTEREASADPAADFEALADAGCGIIFTCGIEADYVLAAAAENPEVYFEIYNGTDNGSLDNVSLFSARIYQQQYLNGMIAGFMSDTGMIGYIAESAENTDIRRVNAFALGAQAANPDAVVHFAWTGESMEAGYELELEASLADEGCYIIYKSTVDEDMLAIADEKDILLMGNAESESNALIQTLEPSVFSYVLSQVRAVVSGNYEPKGVISGWAGMENGEIDLTGYNLTQEQKEAVSNAALKIAGGEWAVFTGPINDVYGQTIIPEGVVIPDEDLLYMLWYVGNIKAVAPPMG